MTGTEVNEKHKKFIVYKTGFPQRNCLEYILKVHETDFKFCLGNFLNSLIHEKGSLSE